MCRHNHPDSVLNFVNIVGLLRGPMEGSLIGKVEVFLAIGLETEVFNEKGQELEVFFTHEKT